MPIVTAGKIPRGYQFFAIGIIVIATIFAFLANEGPIWPPFAALCSQIFKVFQIFFEKKLLHEVKILDSQIVSGEGICAFIFSAVIILPLAYVIPGSDVSSLSGGALENVIDGLSVMFSSVKIILGAFILILSAFLSSSSTVLLPGDRQSVHFVVIDIIVSVLTWTILLIMGGEYGELLSTKSIWQIFALILYAFASLVYNQIIRFKCFRYSEWTLISNQEKPIELLEDID
ncbi:putative membrane spanning protein [Histomonas meleagridis]|uniref:putative membrane spanning protein n=1 Tax=Histomonas meleagridis TaxID=135588 RepID=UPI00355A76F4|nr:putative membrane spanning protein [Histomonas meleagridis]KAH0804797.1 putative membrane spanning protein [Histomonas meleagridis]